MRNLRWIPMLAALALGACSQSLTGGNSGNTSGTGGAGGSDQQSACANLVSEYVAAVAAAQSCDVGQSGECQLLVPAALSSCGACPTYVNDDSKPKAIQQAWLDAGCNQLASGPCAQELCLAIPSVCAVVLDTNRGTCVAGPAGTGGSAPDAGLSTCASLAQKYDGLLPIARSCAPGGGVQCTVAVPTALSACASGCTTYVNDATDLNAVRQAWTDAGCAQAAGTVACPAIACARPIGGMCAETDGGGATCTTSYAAL